MPHSHPLLFSRLRWRLLHNAASVLLQRHLVRVFTILACSALVWGSLFAVSYFGFEELHERYDFPLDGPTLRFVFSLMFMALTVLLIFSTGIILYSSLFASPESAFLLSSPVREDRVFAYKFQGAVGFSSWAFVLLGSPVLIAYGLAVSGGAPWYFYALLPLFFFGFVLLPGSLGALACLLLVNLLPRHRKQVLAASIAALVLLLGVWMMQRFGVGRGNSIGTRDWFNQLISEISIVNSTFMPAHWISGGLQAAALGEVDNTLYYLVLICSNGLFLYVVTAWLASKLYRRGFNRVATGGTLRRRYGGHWLDHVLERLLFFLRPTTRLLIVKDFRTFRRDPAQWAQILIFLALAVLYFSNIRKFYEQEIGRRFQTWISLLTLTATAFLMCAYTGRFIFPMLSLEGRKFWILGLLPLQRDHLLWGKFAFSATGSLIVAEFLVVFSNYMLNMRWQIILLHVLVVFVLSFGLSGLSVGLGAIMPNFRETDPSKIAVGFGGTLNLVACLLFLVAVTMSMAVPVHFRIASVKEDENWFSQWLWLGQVGGILLGALAVLLPLRAGARNLRRIEF